MVPSKFQTNNSPLRWKIRFLYNVEKVKSSQIFELVCAFETPPAFNHIIEVALRSHHTLKHDDVIKWKYFPRYWPFVWGIHRSPVNSPHKGQWRGALMFSLIGVWINGWVNNGEAGDLRRYRAHDDVIVMEFVNLGALKSSLLSFSSRPCHSTVMRNHTDMQWVCNGVLWSSGSQAIVIQFVRYAGVRPLLALDIINGV